VTHLRFCPREYQALSALCRTSDLSNFRPYVFRRFLVCSLVDTQPVLAQRIALMSKEELLLLHQHLQGSQEPAETHGLSMDEMRLFAAAAGPLLGKTRFRRSLKGAFAQYFRKPYPDLAAKLKGLSQDQFEALCRQIA
jgi:hypothetical protein